MALAFQEFQRDFGRHLRDPHHAPRPAGLPARRVAAYNELLFNNICGFLDACFPVSRELLGESRWRRLNRTFYRDWPLHTPWFREIPREFVRYLADAEIATARPRVDPATGAEVRGSRRCDPIVLGRIIDPHQMHPT